MTNEVAIKIFKRLIKHGFTYDDGYATEYLTDDEEEACKLAIHALEQTQWIPVSERLPKDGKFVLFCDIDDDIMVGYHVKGRPNTHFSQDGTFEDMKNVRAWMPLPQPYEPQERSEE